MASHRTKGVTFIELIVAGALTLMLMTLCFTVFISSWRRFHAMNVMQDVHNSATFAMEKLGKDLRESTAQNLYYVADDYLCFPSARDEDGNYALTTDKKPVWKSWIIYYRPGMERRILKKRVDITDDPGPGAMYLKTKDVPAQVVAREVQAFIIEPAPLSGTPRSLQVTIDTRSDYQGKACTFSIKRVFNIRDL